MSTKIDKRRISLDHSNTSSRGGGIWRRCRFLWGFGVDADFYGDLASMPISMGIWRRCRKTKKW